MRSCSGGGVGNEEIPVGNGHKGDVREAAEGFRTQISKDTPRGSSNTSRDVDTDYYVKK